jgi:hypothetical protein
MRFSGRHFLASFVIATASLACATPAPLVRLHPKAGEVVWVSGRASVMRAERGVRVAVAFDHQDGAALGLRVEVENQTEANLNVDPREFRYTACRGVQPTSCAPAGQVIDPERVLLTLDERRSRERADAANGQAVLGTMVILSAVGDAATIASGRATRNTGTGTVAAASLMQSDAAARNSSLSSIAVQQAIWSNEALRRNTLFPGRGTAGRIYLPIDIDARIVWLHVRTGGRVFSFPFQQIVTDVGAAQASGCPHPTASEADSGWRPEPACVDSQPRAQPW